MCILRVVLAVTPFSSPLKDYSAGLVAFYVPNLVSRVFLLPLGRSWYTAVSRKVFGKKRESTRDNPGRYCE